MINVVPTVEQVRAALAALNYAQLDRLSALSGVPFHTLRKVRDGETQSPRLDTVAAFLPHIDAAAITQFQQQEAARAA